MGTQLYIDDYSNTEALAGSPTYRIKSQSFLKTNLVSLVQFSCVFLQEKLNSVTQVNFQYFFQNKQKKLKSCFNPLTVTCSVSFQKTESSSSACSTSSSQRTTCGASLSPSAASRNAPSSEVPTATAKVSLCSCTPTVAQPRLLFFLI